MQKISINLSEHAIELLDGIIKKEYENHFMFTDPSTITRTRLIDWCICMTVLALEEENKKTD